MEIQKFLDVIKIKSKQKLTSLNSKRFKIKLANLKGKMLNFLEKNKVKNNYSKIPKINFKESSRH